MTPGKFEKMRSLGKREFEQSVGMNFTEVPRKRVILDESVSFKP
jgi:hypothetical protein